MTTYRPRFPYERIAGGRKVPATSTTAPSGSISGNPSVTVTASATLVGAGALVGAAAAGATATATATSSHPELLLSAHASGRYLVNALGQPFFVKGDASWCINTACSPTVANAKGATQNGTMSTRASQGWNVLTMQLISRYQSLAPNDYDNIAPFNTPNDITTPNDTYFNRAVDVVERGAGYGIVFFVAPSWFGYDSGQGWYNQLTSAGASAVQTYCAYVAAKFEHCDNIVWIVGGDKPGGIDTAIADAQAAGIRSVDTRHLITSHWNFRSSASHPDSGSDSNLPSPGDWVDINGCYDWTPGNPGIVYQQVATEYARSGYSGTNSWATRPVVVLEALYYENTEFGATRKILRYQLYSSLLSGAKGFITGEEALWHNGSDDTNLPSQSQGKTYDLNTVAAQDAQKHWSLVSAVDWYSLVPDTGSSFVTSSRSSGSTYVTAAKTARQGLVFVPNGGSVTVDCSQLAGSVLARWYDPVGGTYTTSGVYSGSQTLSVPGSNSGGDNDWLLVLDSIGGAPILQSARSVGRYTQLRM